MYDCRCRNRQSNNWLCEWPMRFPTCLKMVGGCMKKVLEFYSRFTHLMHNTTLNESQRDLLRGLNVVVERWRYLRRVFFSNVLEAC